jgi:hypothetical protein
MFCKISKYKINDISHENLMKNIKFLQILILSNISATSTDFEKTWPKFLRKCYSIALETKIAIKSKNKDFYFLRFFGMIDLHNHDIFQHQELLC